MEERGGDGMRGLYRHQIHRPHNTTRIHTKIVSYIRSQMTSIIEDMASSWEKFFFPDSWSCNKAAPSQVSTETFRWIFLHCTRQDERWTTLDREAGPNDIFDEAGKLQSWRLLCATIRFKEHRNTASLQIICVGKCNFVWPRSFWILLIGLFKSLSNFGIPQPDRFNSFLGIVSGYTTFFFVRAANKKQHTPVVWWHFGGRSRACGNKPSSWRPMGCTLDSQPSAFPNRIPNRILSDWSGVTLFAKS